MILLRRCLERKNITLTLGIMTYWPVSCELEKIPFSKEKNRATCLESD
jgi:hypothetical protein